MHRATLLGRYADRHLDPPRVRFRRAVALAFMSAFVPGSAQVALARTWLRRLILLGWFGFAAALGFGLYQFYTDHARFIAFFASRDRLQWIQIAIIAAALIWVLLLLHAWRLGDPERLRAGPRLTVGVLNLALILSVGTASAFAVYTVEAPRNAVQDTFTATEVSTPIEGRYNVLLLGSDSGDGRDGMRPDAITLVSTDASTGETVLISLPRNLQNFDFPADSPLREHFPYGFNCGPECMINAVNTYGDAHPELYPGSEHPGLDATIDAVRGVTGLDVNYFIVINMEGFARLIDALGGLEINVQDRVAIGGGSSPVRGYIEPGVQDLNGDHVMWFARSREGSDDYARMGRQKCVLLAMSEQLDPARVLTNTHEILGAGSDMLYTNIPESDLSTFVELGLRAQGATIGTVSFVPPEINTAYPDLALIRRTVDEAIGRETAPSPDPTPEPEPTPEPMIVFGPTLDADDTDGSGLPRARAANNAEDLTEVC